MAWFKIPKTDLFVEPRQTAERHTIPLESKHFGVSDAYKHTIPLESEIKKEVQNRVFIPFHV